MYIRVWSFRSLRLFIASRLNNIMSMRCNIWRINSCHGYMGWMTELIQRHGVWCPTGLPHGMGAFHPWRFLSIVYCVDSDLFPFFCELLPFFRFEMWNEEMNGWQQWFHKCLLIAIANRNVKNWPYAMPTVPLIRRSILTKGILMHFRSTQQFKYGWPLLSRSQCIWDNVLVHFAKTERDMHKQVAMLRHRFPDDENRLCKHLSTFSESQFAGRSQRNDGPIMIDSFIVLSCHWLPLVATEDTHNFVARLLLYYIAISKKWKRTNKYWTRMTN